MLTKQLCTTVGRLACAAALVLSFAVPAVSSAQTPYTVLAKWAIGGDGWWDYLAVDPTAPRLYLTHGTQVDVVDTSTGKLVGSITGLKGTHGVVFDTDGKTAYISDGGANAVIVFDKATMQKVATIATGTNPDGMAFEPKTRTVWAFNGRSKDATVIDAATRKVVATIPLPGKPEFPQVDDKGTVFVNIEDKNEIIRLDAATLKPTATWPLTGCDSPSGMAIDLAGHRLFSVCDGKKSVVVDSLTGKLLAHPAIGEGPDAAGYDAAHKLAFSSNGDGTLTVIDFSKPGYRALQNVTTQRSARTMAFDPANGRVYLVAAAFGATPAATAKDPHPRPSIVPGSFSVIVVGTK